MRICRPCRAARNPGDCPAPSSKRAARGHCRGRPWSSADSRRHATGAWTAHTRAWTSPCVPTNEDGSNSPVSCPANTASISSSETIRTAPNRFRSERCDRKNGLFASSRDRALVRSSCNHAGVPPQRVLKRGRYGCVYTRMSRHAVSAYFRACLSESSREEEQRVASASAKPISRLRLGMTTADGAKRAVERDDDRLSPRSPPTPAHDRSVAPRSAGSCRCPRRWPVGAGRWRPGSDRCAGRGCGGTRPDDSPTN